MGERTHVAHYACRETGHLGTGESTMVCRVFLVVTVLNCNGFRLVW